MDWIDKKPWPLNNKHAYMWKAIMLGKECETKNNNCRFGECVKCLSHLEFRFKLIWWHIKGILKRTALYDFA